ncbi:helix-turn-helix domain-containing protein [Candidatus Merdisoma sp. JLR.KK006]|jgi:hypothetical protein|uniref:PucR family transcriptional regulator n=1 Tax=Candidatus Merdisoma sp. JLR.KK006 TaxID=3112626 RepID=UPI002FF3D146
MKLSTSILAHKLKSKFTLQNKKALSDELHLEQVLFYCDGNDMLSHKIYICSQEQVSEQDLIVPEDAVLFCIGKVRTQNTGRNGQVFQLVDDTSPFVLFNEIQRLFEYYSGWDERLCELANQEGNIQEMLDESFRIFRNPVIVNSADYFVIGYSSVIDTRSELSGLVDPDAIFEYSGECRDTEQQQNLIKKKGSYFFPDYITGSKSLCVNIFEHDRFAYRVTMVESLRRFEAYDGALLEHLTGYIKMALSKQLTLQTDMGYRLDRILSDILLNPGQDDEVTRQWFSEFGWMPEHRYFCINLKVAALDLENMTVRFICSHIENMLGNSCAFQYENNITIFVNLTRFGGGIDDAMDKIVYFLRDSFLKAGLSNEFTGFEAIHYYYRQAAVALEVGNRRAPFRWIHRFDEIALDYLLEQSKGELPKELVCSQKILSLKTFDEDHNTDYYNTLMLYVKNHLNAVQTAKQLYIHRSTFLYRMEKIKELIHLELDDYDTLLYVMMTFRMMELEGPS